MLGDLEALSLNVSGSFFYDKRKGGKIWALRSLTNRSARELEWISYV